MKACFVHDHYFVYNNENKFYYDGSGGVFDEKMWSRYLEVFDSLIVIGREKESLPNKLVKSSSENVSFELINDLATGIDRFTKRNQVKKKLEISLSKVEFVIVRLPSILGYIAQEICIEQNKKYVLEIVACPLDAYWNYGNIAGKILAPFEYYKLKRAVKKSDSSIYVTQFFLQNRYPNNSETVAISNVNIDEVILKEKAVEFYKSYNKEKKVFAIGLIGSFHVKYKGHVEVLKAIKFLKEEKQLTNIKVYFVGTGDAQWVIDYAKKLNVLDQLEIVGTVKAGKDGIIPFLDNIHLYVHPSKQEGLPRVVIEALSRGRLALGSTAAGIPELLDSEYLHKPGDWEKLAQDIKYIYDNEDIWCTNIIKNIDKAEEYLEFKLQKKRINYLKKVSC